MWFLGNTGTELPGNAWTDNCMPLMQCKLLWIEASAKCINANK